MARFITFLTDFGLQDDFVGTCHGVMKRIAPDVEILDITHGIAPQAVLQGALTLANTLPFMPEGVHLAVVDPGVGGSRRALAIRDGQGRIHVGPDNGLLIPAAEKLGGVAAAWRLTNPAYTLEPVHEDGHGLERVHGDRPGLEDDVLTGPDAAGTFTGVVSGGAGDNTLATLRAAKFPIDGFMLDVNWLTPVKRRQLVVTGEEGMFELDYLTQRSSVRSRIDASRLAVAGHVVIGQLGQGLAALAGVPRGVRRHVHRRRHRDVRRRDRGERRLRPLRLPPPGDLLRQAPAASASDTSSTSNTAFSMRAETPQARSVRSIGSLCSKASPRRRSHSSRS